MKYLLLVTTLFVCLITHATFCQLPPPCVSLNAGDEPPGCLLCGPVYQGSTATYSQGIPGPFFPCGTIENNQWLSFIAGQTIINATIIPSDCENNQGVQLLIYDQNLVPVSTCFSAGTAIPGNVSASGLIPGEIYWIMIDGFAGDICDFQIIAQGGFLTVPPDPPGPITANPNFNPVCPNVQICYTVPPVNGATDYEWVIPDNGVIVSGDGTNQICVIYDEPGGGVICVTPSNYCFPGVPSCLFVLIENRPLTIRPTEWYCLEAFPVTIDSQEFETPGMYHVTFSSEQDCDSVVVYDVQAFDTSQGLLDISICEGDTLDFQGQRYDTSGIYTIILPGAGSNGCDSTFILRLTVGGGLITRPLAPDQSYTAVCPGQEICYSVGKPANAPYQYLWQVLSHGSFTFDDSSTVACVRWDSLGYGTICLTIIDTTCQGDTTVCLDQLIQDPITTILPPEWYCVEDFPVMIDSVLISLPGPYEFTYPTNRGCDSIVIRTLLQYPAVPGYLEIPICEGDTIYYESMEITAPNLFELVYENASADGCDSLLTLVVYPVEDIDSNVIEPILADPQQPFYCAGTEACYSILPLSGASDYIWSVPANVAILHGQGTPEICVRWEEPGSGEIRIIASNECYQTLPAAVSVVVQSEIRTEIPPSLHCRDDFPVEIDGHQFPLAGTYQFSFSGSNQCDSIVIYSVKEYPVDTHFIDTMICEGDFIVVANTILNQVGLHDIWLSDASANGCDSLILVDLQWIPSLRDSITGAIASDNDTRTVCPGQTVCYRIPPIRYATEYQWSEPTLGVIVSGQGTNEVCIRYDTTGQEVICVTPYNACSSAAVSCLFEQVRLIRPTNHPPAWYCPEEFPVTIDSIEFERSGTFEYTFPSAKGCDSVVTYVLNAYDATPGRMSVTFCAGSAIEVHGLVIDASGTYTFEFPGGSVHGCDSILIVHAEAIIPLTTVVLSADEKTLTVLDSSGTYQWLDCNGFVPIRGATGRSFTPTVSGEYAVRVAKDRCIDTSACVSVIVTDIEEKPAGFFWNYFPNPFTQHLRIDIQAQVPGQFELRILDVTGKLWLEKTYTGAVIGDQLNLTAWPDGLYLIELRCQENISVRKLVKAGR